MHERLVAELDEFDRLLVHPVRFNTALRVAVKRHRPVPRSPLDGGGFSCPVCVEHCSELGEHTCIRGNVEAPCDEIKAIAEALGVDGG